MKRTISIMIMILVSQAALIAVTGCTKVVQPIEVVEEEVIVEAQEIHDEVILESEVIEEPKEVTYESDFDWYCAQLREAAELNDLDAELMIAISRLETGNFTSAAFEQGNWGGLTSSNGVMTFTNKSEGLDAFTKTMCWYRDNGMTTPESMAQVYCPANNQWPALVRELMKEGMTK